MSWQASAWALDQVKGIGANCKLVLLALCEFANDEQVTWRSMESIAERSECSVRTAKRHLQSLEAWGLISRSPRYRWCGSDSPECANRGAHKHRSGTDYRVNLEVGIFDLAHTSSASVAEPAKDEPVDNEPVDNSTGAKLAPVEQTAESSGKRHKCQIGTCGTGEADSVSTGANTGIPQVPILAPIRSYNPHMNLQPTNQPREQAQVVSGSVASVDGWMADQPSKEDLELLRTCLPATWQQVAVGTAVMPVVQLLRTGIEAGWTPARIEQALGRGKSLDGAENPAGLLIYRVKGLVSSPPPASGQDLNRARRKSREHEVTALLRDILAHDDSHDPNDDKLAVMGLSIHGLSKEVLDLYEQTFERVEQRRKLWRQSCDRVSS